MIGLTRRWKSRRQRDGFYQKSLFDSFTQVYCFLETSFYHFILSSVDFFHFVFFLMLSKNVAGAILIHKLTIKTMEHICSGAEWQAGPKKRFSSRRSIQRYQSFSLYSPSAAKRWWWGSGSFHPLRSTKTKQTRDLIIQGEAAGFVLKEESPRGVCKHVTHIKIQPGLRQLQQSGNQVTVCGKFWLYVSILTATQ